MEKLVEKRHIYLCVNDRWYYNHHLLHFLRSFHSKASLAKYFTQLQECVWLAKNRSTFSERVWNFVILGTKLFVKKFYSLC